MSSFDLILFPYKIHLKSRKINLGLTSSRKMKLKEESALVRTLNPATPGHSGRKPVQGPWVLAVRTGCPACPGHRLPPHPPSPSAHTCCAWPRTLVPRPSLETSGPPLPAAFPSLRWTPLRSPPTWHLPAVAWPLGAAVRLCVRPPRA